MCKNFGEKKYTPKDIEEALINGQNNMLMDKKTPYSKEVSCPRLIDSHHCCKPDFLHRILRN